MAYVQANPYIIQAADLGLTRNSPNFIETIECFSLHPMGAVGPKAAQSADEPEARSALRKRPVSHMRIPIQAAEADRLHRR